MGLVGVSGSASAVNMALLLHAFEYDSCLFIDCANCANPHSVFPHILPEQFDRVHVVEVELIYSLRDLLRRLRTIAGKVKAQCIILTTFSGLFHYSNEEENRAIHEHVWQLLRYHARAHQILVGVERGSAHARTASRYCDRVEELML